MKIDFFDRTYSFDQIDSTFAEAKRLINNQKGEGNFLVVADKQTAGIGRSDNRWYSPHGGLWFTASLYNLPVKSYITIFTALMIIKAVVKLYPETKDFVSIKWPNDIFLNGRKLAGILTSFFPSQKYLLIGVGINTNNHSFPDALKAVSLSSFLQQFGYEAIDHQLLLNEIFSHFGMNLPDLLEGGLKTYTGDYHNYSLLEGKRVVLTTEFQDFAGVVKGINNEGALLLQFDNGFIQPFLSGSIKSF